MKIRNDRDVLDGLCFHVLELLLRKAPCAYMSTFPGTYLLTFPGTYLSTFRIKYLSTFSMYVRIDFSTVRTRRAYITIYN